MVGPDVLGCIPLTGLVLAGTVLVSPCFGGDGTPLPRSANPEAEGVSSEGIAAYLAEAAVGHELHTFMMLRHGNVVAEGSWLPYRLERKNTLYSASKSFTSTAIGFAVQEGRLALTDKVVSFFPDRLPASVSANLAALSVRDLLTMSAGMEPDPSFAISGRESDWVRAFLAQPVVHPPGSRFLYNSLATYMLSAILQKVSGETVLHYLTPRLFAPLGITGMDWEVDPRGINTGGWGLRLTTEEMAKFGQLLLQKGRWEGKQVVPAEWVEEATTYKIDSAPDASTEAKAADEWGQGYCYQFWRCRHGAFRADGAFGQYILVLPEEDAVIVITGETNDMGGELEAVWRHLLPAMRPAPLPPNPLAASALQQMLKNLLVSPPTSGAAPSVLAKIAGRTFRLDDNPVKLASLRLTFDGGRCMRTVTMDSTTSEAVFGQGVWEEGVTSRPGPSLFKVTSTTIPLLRPFKVAGTYAWTDATTLELRLQYVETPHAEIMTCRFDDAGVRIELRGSLEAVGKPVVLTGVLSD